MSVHHHKSLPSRQEFAFRLFKFFLLACVILGFSLLFGMIGYHKLGNLSWIDSLLNASMILTGMGPVDEMKTNGAKLFASLYALYSGIAFLTTVAVMLSPALHRFMHILHLETTKD